MNTGGKAKKGAGRERAESLMAGIERMYAAAFTGSERRSIHQEVLSSSGVGTKMKPIKSQGNDQKSFSQVIPMAGKSAYFLPIRHEWPQPSLSVMISKARPCSSIPRRLFRTHLNHLLLVGEGELFLSQLFFLPMKNCGLSVVNPVFCKIS